jgi:hypothetical protein
MEAAKEHPRFSLNATNHLYVCLNTTPTLSHYQSQIIPYPDAIDLSMMRYDFHRYPNPELGPTRQTAYFYYDVWGHVASACGMADPIDGNGRREHGWYSRAGTGAVLGP